jgi:hypothetical protein
MTAFRVIVAVVVIVGLLVLADRRQRRHEGNIDELQAGRTKGIRYM